MAYFQWTDRLTLGNRFIDADHRHIITLINEFHDAMRGGKADAITDQVLFNLIVYCKGHFLREEEQMKAIGFSGYEEHKREHERFSSTVAALYDHCKAGAGTPLTIETANFLRDWLTNHILKSDMALAEALRKAA